MKTLSVAELIARKGKSQGFGAAERARMEHWIRRFMSYYDEQPLASMGSAQVREFLRHLNKDHTLSASDRMSACNALTFLYNEVVPALHKEPKAPSLEHSGLLSWQDAWSLVRALESPWNLMATLVLGVGARTDEVLDLRLSDVDFRKSTMTLGHGKSRRTLKLATPLLKGLQQQVARVMHVFREDRRLKRIFVMVEHGGRKSYVQDSRQYPLFPGINPALDLASGKHVRGVVDREEFEKRLRRSAIRLGISCHVSASALRQAFVLRQLDRNVPVEVLARHLGCAPEDIRLFRNLDVQERSKLSGFQDTTPYSTMDIPAANKA